MIKTRTKTFSLPNEIAEKIEKFSDETELNESTIAKKAFTEFFEKRPDAQFSTAQPTPTPTTQAN